MRQLLSDYIKLLRLVLCIQQIKFYQLVLGSVFRCQKWISSRISDNKQYINSVQYIYKNTQQQQRAQQNYYIKYKCLLNNQYPFSNIPVCCISQPEPYISNLHCLKQKTKRQKNQAIILGRQIHLELFKLRIIKPQIYKSVRIGLKQIYNILITLDIDSKDKQNNFQKQYNTNNAINILDKILAVVITAKIIYEICTCIVKHYQNFVVKSYKILQSQSYPCIFGYSICKHLEQPQQIKKKLSKTQFTKELVKIIHVNVSNSNNLGYKSEILESQFLCTIYKLYKLTTYARKLPHMFAPNTLVTVKKKLH
eukprot:TRINITY_DN204_c0_g1_i11.p1 TRINITY_DN204_c0_g1~~TRINITY_DN204_c0_g1_i11.p1  ORF type:complete len:309 (+),score=-27.98 TRINITY_DN204_c0_g1_i11:493-1419(+)